MRPDSTILSDKTGTRDKGVGTRAKVTERQWLVDSEEVLCVIRQATKYRNSVITVKAGIHK